MAINMMCMNSECEYYWEDNCMKNINEERIEIDSNGKCITYKKGISDWYKDEERDVIYVIPMDDVIDQYERRTRLIKGHEYKVLYEFGDFFHIIDETKKVSYFNKNLFYEQPIK